MAQPAPKHNIFAAQWLFLAVVVAVLSMLTGYALYEEHQRIREREEGWLLSMSRVMQLSVEQNLVSINKVLVMLADDLRDFHGKGRLDDRLAVLAKAMPGTRSIQIHDAVGRLQYSSLAPGTDAHIDFSQYDFIRIPQRQPSGTNTLFVSPPFRTVDDVLTIALSRIVTGQGNEFLGVVVVQLKPDYFDSMLNSVRYAPNMAASLHHGDGIILLMYPHDRDDIVGRSLLQPGSFFLQHKESGRAATVFSGYLQTLGEERMIAQRDIHPSELNMDKHLGVAISRPIADIYALWQHDFAMAATLIGFTATALGSGLFLYQRRLRHFLAMEAQSNLAITASEHKLRTILDTQPECVMVTDAAGTMLQINQAGLALIEREEETQAVGRNIREYLLPTYEKSFTSFIDSVLAGGICTLDYEIRGHNGRQHWVSSRAAPMRDSAGAPMGMVVVTREISEQKRMQTELEHQAKTDTLTGLANRRHFLQQAEGEISRAIRYGGSLSLLMIDIDRFKNINDDHGHQIGDRVLQKTGKLFVETLRGIDCVARIGGEEFAVLLPQTDETRALEVAERLRARISELAVTTGEGPAGSSSALRFSISVGVTTFDGNATSIDTLLDQADKALYTAKRGGRNRVCIFRTEAEEDSERQ